MSAFADLIREAENLGVSKLTWACDVRGWANDPQREGRWTCRSTVRGADDAVTTVYEGMGRTGEEALRVVVCFLRGLR